MKQAVAWWCLTPRALTPEQLVLAAAEIGYAGIELAEPEYWPLIRQHGLTIVSTRGHESLTDGLNRRENHDRIEREILANLKVAEQWDIPVLICFSGNRNGLADDQGAEITAEGLRRVALAAEDTGVTLAVELLNSKVNHPDYQCDRTAWGLRVCELVGSPRVKLLYDIYHMQVMEGDVIRTIRDHHAAFGHYHTAGNPGRNELDETQELNYRAIVRAIRETGYDGYIGQEFIPRGEPVAALRAAFEVCQG
ncbi:MAG TPA: TIM barrel protein [Thermomicrobiales bacterium]|nr:TIM barrel protein [Thermomicrobiales bacterium]